VTSPAIRLDASSSAHWRSSTSPSTKSMPTQLRAPQDPLQQQFRQMIKNWRDIQGMSDDVVARDIRADKIDILVNLAGHTAHNRLSMFTYKPAPVAFTWLGYFASTGVAAIDYVLCNRWLLPESELTHFDRRAVVPARYAVVLSRPAQDGVAPLPAGDTGTITFGSFNNFHKLSPATIALWARVIRISRFPSPPALQCRAAGRRSAHGGTARGRCAGRPPSRWFARPSLC